MVFFQVNNVTFTKTKQKKVNSVSKNSGMHYKNFQMHRNWAMPSTSSVVLALFFLTLTRMNQFRSPGTYTRGLQGGVKNKDLRNGVDYQYQIKTIVIQKLSWWGQYIKIIVPKESITDCNSSAIANNHPGNAFSIFCVSQWPYRRNFVLR